MKRNLYVVFIISLMVAAWPLHAKEIIEARKVAKQTWYRATTPNFVVITDASQKTATRLVENLERFRAMFEVIYGYTLDQRVRPVKVIATKRSKTYRFLHGDSEHMEKTAGFFRDSITGNYAALKLNSASRQQNLSILFHEYTHYLTANLTSVNSPYWYSEGLAEFLANTQFKDDSTIDYGLLDRHHLVNMSRMQWMPLDELLRTTYISHKKSRKRYRIYSQGWLLTHYLHSQEVGSKGKQFIKLLGQGASPKEASEQAFSKSVGELNRELRRYLWSRLMFTRIKLVSPLDTSEISVVKLRPAEQLYELGEFALQASGDYSLARPMFEAALEFEPNHAAALAGLANTYLGSDNEAVRRLIARAKDAAGEDPWVATISGHYNQSLYQSAKGADKDKYWNATVRDYNIAINQGGINLEALHSAASLYMGKGRYEKATELLEYAYSLAPNNYSLRRSLIRVYVADDKLDQAEQLAVRIKRNHHWSEKTTEAFDKWYRELLESAGE